MYGDIGQNMAARIVWLYIETHLNIQMYGLIKVQRNIIHNGSRAHMATAMFGKHLQNFKLLVNLDRHHGCKI